MKLLDLRQLELSLTLTLRRRSLQARIPSLVPPAPAVRTIETTATPATLRPIAKTRGNVVELSSRRAKRSA